MAIQQLLAAYGSGGGGGPTDPNFANVLTLLHFDGANGGTTFSDNAPSPLTYARQNATTSTTQIKFGSASGSFAGTNQNINTTMPSLGAGDYSIELQCYPTSVAAGYKAVAFFAGAGIGLYLKGNTFLWFEGAADRCISSAVTANAWYQIDIRRVGGVVSLYVNTVASGTTYSSGAGALSGSFYVGMSGAATEPFTGFIDELRVTKTVARSVATQTAAFPDS